MREEMLVHEMMKTLRMCGGKSQIFVKIKSNDAREIERSLLVKTHEMFVDADHRAAGGQAKHQRRLLMNSSGDELRGL